MLLLSFYSYMTFIISEQLPLLMFLCWSLVSSKLPFSLPCCRLVCLEIRKKTKKKVIKNEDFASEAEPGVKVVLENKKVG